MTPGKNDQKIRWTKTSSAILGGFLLVLFLIGYVWWPLLDEYLSYFNPEISIWKQIDWLLIENFLVMSILITMNADIREDLLYGIIALGGVSLLKPGGRIRVCGLITHWKSHHFGSSRPGRSRHYP